jgi:hypothetical protein
MGPVAHYSLILGDMLDQLKNKIKKPISITEIIQKKITNYLNKKQTKPKFFIQA